MFVASLEGTGLKWRVGREKEREKRASSLISIERDRETGGDNKGWRSGNRFSFLSV